MYRKALVLSTVLLAITCHVNAQGFGFGMHTRHFHDDYGHAVRGGFQKFYQRAWIGYLKPFSGFNLDEHFSQNAPDIYVGGVYQANPKPNVDTTVSRKGKLVNSWGVAGGGFCPVGMLNDNSCLAISFSVMMLFQTWNLGPVTYSNQETSLTDPGGQAIAVHGLIPVGIDYKYGGEAALNKEKRFSFTFGVGVAPDFYASGYGSTGTVSYKTLPYAKMEMSFFAGVAFKLEAMAFLGKYDYFKDYSDDRFVTNGATTYDHTDATAYGNSPFVLSLGIMPYSFHWGDEDNVGKERW